MQIIPRFVESHNKVFAYFILISTFFSPRNHYKIILTCCAVGSSRDVIEDISGIWEKVRKATSIFQLDASLELPEVTLRVGVGHGTRRGARRTWLSAEMLPIPLLGQISHGVHLRGRS